ncbi:MAG: hypothetical protein ABF967_02265 [Lacticaseibacillus paracasei]
MNPKKNRVVETPHSLRINGHFIPWVTKVKVDNPGSPTDELREITVTFVAGSYRFRQNRQPVKLKLLEFLTHVARYGHTTHRRLLALKILSKYYQ